MKKFTMYTAGCTDKPKNTYYPTEVVVQNLKVMEQAMRRDHVCAAYRDNCRGNNNFLHSNCIPMDCDNDHSDKPEDWKTPEDIKNTFPNVTFAVCYSRHNMKEKNGKAPRPKFHCYFPIAQVDDAALYIAMKQQLQRAFPEFDANALDAGRFLLGVEDPQVMYYDGNKTIDELFIPAGNRNETLHKKAVCLIKRYGNTPEVRNMYHLEASWCLPPLPPDELESIWNSASKYGKKIAETDGYIPPSQFNSAHEKLKAMHPESNSRYAWTDLGAGHLFADYYKDIARYVAERKCWYCYANGVWEQDVGNIRAMSYCMALADSLILYALSILDERQR